MSLFYGPHTDGLGSEYLIAELLSIRLRQNTIVNIKLAVILV